MNSRMSGMNPHRSYDKVLLFIMLLLLAFGSLMIYSSTAVVTPLLAKKNITEFYYFKRHLFTIVMGSIALLAAYSLKPSFLKKIAVPLLVFSFFLLLLVFRPAYRGVGRRGQEMDKIMADHVSALGARKACHGHLPGKIYVSGRLQY